MQNSNSASSDEPQRLIRRVMLPATEERTQESADAEDARKIRWGYSPSYYLNLGSLTGNRYTGHMNIYPRRLYKFEEVYPTGINEDPTRLDEERPEQLAYQTKSRQPRTCAEDVRSEADWRVFAILSSLTDRDDAELIWDVIYPVAAEAEVYAVTLRNIRGPIEPWVKAYYEEIGLEAPYVRQGHALALFIQHLERNTPNMILEAGLSLEQIDVAEACLAEILEAANNVMFQRSSALGTSFGSIEARKNSGKGKNKLSKHDTECMAETGIDRPENLPVRASQELGVAMAQEMSESNDRTASQLAQAVEKIAAGQASTNEVLAILGQAVTVLLNDRNGSRAQQPVADESKQPPQIEGDGL
jgi:hypothetical protein